MKTSTGYGGGGATVEDVALMRRTVGATMGVKASGGIRTLAQALAMVQAGATRIGASSGVHGVPSRLPVRLGTYQKKLMHYWRGWVVLHIPLRW